MMKRFVLPLCMLALALFLGACASPEAREQALTGDMQHPRSDTGMDSQVGDTGIED